MSLCHVLTSHSITWYWHSITITSPYIFDLTSIQHKAFNALLTLTRTPFIAFSPASPFFIQVYSSLCSLLIRQFLIHTISYFLSPCVHLSPFFINIYLFLFKILFGFSFRRQTLSNELLPTTFLWSWSLSIYLSSWFSTSPLTPNSERPFAHHEDLGLYGFACHLGPIYHFRRLGPKRWWHYWMCL